MSKKGRGGDPYGGLYSGGGGGIFGSGPKGGPLSGSYLGDFRPPKQLNAHQQERQDAFHARKEEERKAEDKRYEYKRLSREAKDRIDRVKASGRRDMATLKQVHADMEAYADGEIRGRRYSKTLAEMEAPLSEYEEREKGGILSYWYSSELHMPSPAAHDNAIADREGRALGRIEENIRRGVVVDDGDLYECIQNQYRLQRLTERRYDLTADDERAIRDRVATWKTDNAQRIAGAKATAEARAQRAEIERREANELRAIVERAQRVDSQIRLRMKDGDTVGIEFLVEEREDLNRREHHRPVVPFFAKELPSHAATLMEVNVNVWFRDNGVERRSTNETTLAALAREQTNDDFRDYRALLLEGMNTRQRALDAVVTTVDGQTHVNLVLEQQRDMIRLRYGLAKGEWTNEDELTAIRLLQQVVERESFRSGARGDVHRRVAQGVTRWVAEREGVLKKALAEGAVRRAEHEAALKAAREKATALKRKIDGAIEPEVVALDDVFAWAIAEWQVETGRLNEDPDIAVRAELVDQVVQWYEDNGVNSKTAALRKRQGTWRGQ